MGSILGTREKEERGEERWGEEEEPGPEEVTETDESVTVTHSFLPHIINPKTPVVVRHVLF